MQQNVASLAICHAPGDGEEIGENHLLQLKAFRITACIGFTGKLLGLLLTSVGFIPCCPGFLGLLLACFRITACMFAKLLKFGMPFCPRHSRVVDVPQTKIGKDTMKLASKYEQIRHVFCM